MGMESGDAAVGSGETSCGSARHGIVYSIKPAHSTCHITEDAGYGEEEIYSPYPLGASAQSGMELAADGSCSLGREHLDITAHHRRQDGNGEEDSDIVSKKASVKEKLSIEEWAMSVKEKLGTMKGIMPNRENNIHDIVTTK